MKRYLILSLCIVFSITCLGQKRVNRPKVYFNNEGVILNKVIGWAYDHNTGEWIDWVNCIKAKKLSKKIRTQTKQNAIFLLDCFNNIISLQFKTIKLNNIPYYVLVWEKYNGAYRYPNIREDWQYWKEKIFLMFTEEDMKILRNLSNSPIILNLLAPMKSELERNIIDEDIIQTSMSKLYPLKLSFIIYKATDGCSIRFKFIKNSHDADIDKQYFEISEADYQKFINVKP